MKKLLIVGTIVLLALFTACEQPSVPSNYQLSLDGYKRGGTLPGPANVTATAYDGLIIIKWDAVANATGYKVFRTGASGENKEIAVARGNLWTTDAVSWINQLENGKSYAYTVVTLSGWESRLTATGGNLTDDMILNGQTRTSVTAKIPKWSDFTPAAPTDVTLTQVESGSQEYVLVTFTGEPNLNYTVTYAYGKDEKIVTQTSSLFPNGTNQFSTSYFSPVRAVRFPVIGGDNTVVVKASFVTGSGYYYKTSEVTKPASFAHSFAVGHPFGLTAQSNSDGTEVQFTWNAVPGATDYKLYKIKTGTQATIGSAVTEVSGDWLPVTFTYVDREAASPTVSAKEAFTSVGDNYVYAIIAEGPNNAKSAASFAALTVTPFTVPAMAVQLKTDVNGNPSPAINTSATVQVTWEADVNATYKLSYAEVEPGASVYNYVPKTQFTDVPVTLAANYPQGKAVVDVSLPIMKQYIFKLTATKYGYTASPRYALCDSDPFIPLAFLSFSQDRNVTSSWNDTDRLYNSVKLTTSIINSYYQGHGTNFKLYRREYNSTNPQTTYQQVSTAPATISGNTWTFTDTGLDITKQYQYKLVMTGSFIDAERETEARINGYYASIDSTTYHATAQTGANVANWPARSIALNTSNDGLGLRNLPVTISYSRNGGGTVSTPTTAVQQLTWTDTYGTHFGYYVMLPADAVATGNFTVNYNGTSVNGSY